MAEILAFAAQRSFLTIADTRARFVMRRRIERAIAFMIDVLDAMDGDPDITEQAEDNDLLDYGEEDTSDHEPSLGAPEPHIPYHRPACAMRMPIGDQRLWSAGGDQDHELGDDNGMADMDGLCEQDPAGDGYLPLSQGGYVA